MFFSAYKRELHFSMEHHACHITLAHDGRQTDTGAQHGVNVVVYFI